MKYAFAAAVLSVAVTGAPAFAHDDNASPAVKYRQNAMSAAGDNASSVGMILKKQAGDPAQLEAHLRSIALAASISKAAFSVQEAGGKTKDAFWEDGDKALEGFDDMERLALAAADAMAEGGLAAAGGAINDMFGTCKACHDDYKDK